MRGIMRVLSGIAIMASVATGAAHACAMGGTSSGGGEMLKDSVNPWFIQNTSVVKYCIEIDQVNFHQTKAVVEQVIDQALAYWRKEFANAFKPEFEGLGPKHQIQIATQTFKLGNCNSADLRFQFGVLDDEQRALIGDPRNYVAATIRESYNPVNMRGRGFIYVSPDTGPMAPVGRNIVPNHWRIDGGQRLYAVLLHELGHVFGIQHTGARYDLMGADYPEAIISKPDGNVRPQDQVKVGRFFRYDGSLQDGPLYCVGNKRSLSQSVIDFFGVPAGNWEAIYTRMHDHVLEISVSAKCLDFDHRVLVGTATLETNPSWQPDFGVAVNVDLPPDQHVFPSLPAWLGTNVQAVARVCSRARNLTHPFA